MQLIYKKKLSYANFLYLLQLFLSAGYLFYLFIAFLHTTNFIAVFNLCHIICLMSKVSKRKLQVPSSLTTLPKSVFGRDPWGRASFSRCWLWRPRGPRSVSITYACVRHFTFLQSSTTCWTSRMVQSIRVSCIKALKRHWCFRIYFWITSIGLPWVSR